MIVSQFELANYLGFDLDSMSDVDLNTLNDLHVQCENLVKDYVGYQIESGTYTEFYPDYQQRGPSDMLIDGYELWGSRAVPYPRYFEDRRVLMLKEIPVRSVTSVYEYLTAWEDDPNTPNFPASSLLETGAYMVDYKEQGLSLTGFLYRRNGVWTNYERGVKVTYVAGYTDAELSAKYSRFRLAVKDTVNDWFNQLKARRFNQKTGTVGGAIVQEKLETYQVNLEPVAQRTAFFNQLPTRVMRMLEKDVRFSQRI